MLELTKRPALLRERLLATPPEDLRSPVILDEVQKVPQLLDEVHWLIENQGLSFILCGSSARKLKRGGVNLLGGRAWRYEMHPLTSIEHPRHAILVCNERLPELSRASRSFPGGSSWRACGAGGF